MSSIELTLRITDLARGGAGVARDGEGQVVFVPYAAPGDLLRVRVTQVEKRYLKAEIIEILEASSERQNPSCSIFGKCGGCQWQHLAYALQWKTKIQGVLQSLKRRGIFISDNYYQIPAKTHWNYRNRIQLRGHENQLGFFRQGSTQLVSADSCPIARQEINQVWEKTRAEGRHKKPYKVEIEVLPTGEVVRSWNSDHSALGFRQVNDEQNEEMKKWMLEVLGHYDVLYDLYGGIGNFSISLAPRVKKIHCVDLSAPQEYPSQIPSHIYFHRESVLKWLLRSTASLSRSKGKRKDLSQAKEQLKRVLAILDPPRGGLGLDFIKIATALELLGVTEVITVGCDPDSWAKDLAGWKKRGWIIKKVMVIDLFPQTSHVESLGLLIRGEGL